MSNATSEEESQPADRRVLVGTLFREKRKKRVVFQETPPPPQPAPVRRPAYVARMLALAHHLQGGIDRGLVPDRATVARRLGLTRARVTQLLDLLLLAPDLQDQVLHLEAVDGVEPLSERALRAVGQSGAGWSSGSCGRSCGRRRGRFERRLRVSPHAHRASPIFIALERSL